MVNKWIPIAVGGGIALLGAGVVSALFTTPTASTGVLSYGFTATPETIEEQIEKTVDSTPVTVTVNESTVVNTTLSELGVQVTNLETVSANIYSHDLIWKVGNWWSDPEINLETTVDAEQYNKFLSTHLENVPVTTNANVIWENNVYTVVPGAAGLTLETEALPTAVDNALYGRELASSFVLIPDTPNVVDEEAQVVADEANRLQSELVIKAGTETIKVDVPGALFTFQEEEDTLIKVTDDGVLTQYADSIPEAVNRDAKNGEVIVDSQDNVLYTIEPSHSGLKVKEDSSSIVSKIKTVLAENGTVVEVTVDEVAPVVNKKFRRIDVNLTEQKVRLYENEQIVHEWAVSSGKAGTPTDKGEFKVRAFVRIQDMVSPTYRTPDVPWVVYFNGDEAFHGAYWHNNFGTPMSHGCVNLPIPLAEQLYRFAYVGMEVSVHD